MNWVSGFCVTFSWCHRGSSALISAMFVLTATTTTITTVTYHYCIWSSDCHQHHHHRHHHHRVHNHLISHFDCYFNLFGACDHPLLALAHARRCSRPLFLSFYFSISLCFSLRPSLAFGVSVIAAHLERKHNAMMLLMYIMRRDYHRSAYYADYVFLLPLPPCTPTLPPFSWLPSWHVISLLVEYFTFHRNFDDISAWRGALSANHLITFDT